MSAAALLLITLFTTSQAVSQHEQSMNAGRAAYDAFDLKTAEQGFAAAAAMAASPAERATALVWLGAIHADNGDFDGARSRFRDAVDLHPRVATPEGLSPTIAQLLDEARAQVRVQEASVAVDQPIEQGPRWALISGGAVTMLGVLAVGGGAMVGIQAATQRDNADTLEFQNDAVDEYKKARDGALWSNVLYGAGGVLVATGSSLAIASFLGADQ